MQTRTARFEQTRILRVIARQVGCGLADLFSLQSQNSLVAEKRLEAGAVGHQQAPALGEDNRREYSYSACYEGSCRGCHTCVFALDTPWGSHCRLVCPWEPLASSSFRIADR